MRKTLRTLSVLALCLALAVPTVDAQARGRNQSGAGAGGAATTQQRNRPAAGNKAPSQSSARPSQPSQQRPQATQPSRSNARPSQPSQQRPQATQPSQQRPGNMGGGVTPPSSQRPSTNKPGQQAPGHGNQAHGQQAPGHGYAPQPGHGPQGPGHGPQGPGHGPQGPGPDYGHHGHQHMPPAGRPPVAHYPHHPAPRPFVYPTPPPMGYRPYSGWPVFRSVLGIVFGTTVNMSINALINSGYGVVGYGNDVVYLANVPMLNLSWPSATLYYNNMGGLAASEFVYSTSYYDMSRYNLVYNNLIRNYGAPYQVQALAAGGMQAQWWGPSGEFITLNFSQNYANNGTLRFFTTLSFGI